MPLSVGARLGPYEILAPIGAGGMGEVWKARDTRLNRIVAIKQSRAQFSERFEREAHAIAALNHPHICQLYDVGPNYLVMEYVEGHPLKGPVAVSEALDLAGQILDALDAAHRKGITHRDLKPDNILVGKSGVKILDFGLAKVDHEPESAEQFATKPLTAEGTVLGTLHYMSPEQIEGQEADARSDIFAFGLVLYELITGQPAFEGKTRTSLVASILKDQPRPLSELAPLSPPALDRVVATCLEKDPDKRWQSAREVKHALEWISTESPAAKVPALFARKRRWLWPAVTVAALLAIAGLAYWFWPRHMAPAIATRFWVQPPDKGEFGAALAVSPDGRKLAFTTTGTDGGIWVRDLNALEARQDGKRLAFMELKAGGGFALWTMPIETDENGLRAGKPEGFLRESFDERDPIFSPDGHWLAYMSNESGAFQIYVRPFPDKGGKVQISNAGGSYPVWSRRAPEAGRDLFFRSPDDRIMAASYTVKGDSFVADKPRVWSDKRLAFTEGLPNFDVAPDGKRIAALMPIETSEDQQAHQSQNHVIFLENFFDELRRKAPLNRK